MRWKKKDLPLNPGSASCQLCDIRISYLTSLSFPFFNCNTRFKILWEIQVTVFPSTGSDTECSSFESYDY